MNDDVYAISIDVVLERSDLPAIVKQAALLLRQRGFFTIGEWLSELTDFDLTTLLSLWDIVDRPGPAAFALVTLTEILTAAEGIAASHESTCIDRMKRLSVLMAMESLHRKGLIVFYRNNATLGDDYDDRQIASRVET